MAKVIVIHASDVSAGGVVNATIFYAAALIAAGHPAEVWTASTGLTNRAQALGIPVFFHPWLKNAGLAILTPAIVRRALTVRKQAMATVHQGEKLWLFGRIWLRGATDSVVFHNEKVNQRRLFRRWLAVSGRHRHVLENYAASRGLTPDIHRIRNGPLPYVPLLQPARASVGQPIAIGCLGNFGQKKGVDVLVRAFAETIRRGHDVRLVLGGDGKERAACQELACELSVDGRIEWQGWLEDTRPFFSGIDLFCLPSRSEPFGIVVTEAMQARLPVIATATDGPLDIVVPGETGWLVPADDVTALADALEDAVRSGGKMAAYGAAGYRRYLDCFSPLAAGKVLASALGLPDGGQPHSQAR